MDERIKKELEKEEVTPAHQALLDHCKGLLDISRTTMSSRYEIWDNNDLSFRNQMTSDKEDKNAENRKEPIKGVLPLTRSQVISYVVLTMSVLLQRKKFYELEPTGPEDTAAAKLAEAVLANDLRHSGLAVRLWQVLLDVARFGIGVWKISYETVKSHKVVKEEVPPVMFMGAVPGMDAGMAPPVPETRMVVKEVVDFQGNVITNVSPYNFFPDPRVPISRFQEGEFCGSEHWYSRQVLKQWESEGQIAGLAHVREEMSTETVERRRMPFDAPDSQIGETVHTSQTKGYCILSEVQVNIVPSEFMIDGEPLGKEGYPMKWLVWIVNDERIVKAEPLSNLHNRFTFEVAELYPDTKQLLNEGLADVISHIQNVVSWLINSHVTNVRKAVGDKFLVRDKMVNIKDLAERRPVIRILEQAGDRPLQDVIQQLNVQDVTKQHINDAGFLIDLAQVTTGITDNAQGVFNTGRRSGTEASSVMQAIAARLRIPTLLLWDQLFEPAGRQMISNHQQGLTNEIAVRTMGDMGDVSGMGPFVKVRQESIVGDYDLAIFDGTTSSEKIAQAESLGEMLTNLPGGLQTLLFLGYDPAKIADEWFVLRGIQHPERFKLDDVMAKQYVERMLTLQQLQNGQNTGNGEPSAVPGAGGGVGQETPARFEQ